VERSFNEDLRQGSRGHAVVAQHGGACERCTSTLLGFGGACLSVMDTASGQTLLEPMSWCVRTRLGVGAGHGPSTGVERHAVARLPVRCPLPWHLLHRRLRLQRIRLGCLQEEHSRQVSFRRPRGSHAIGALSVL